jgi:hypothetical protein
LWLGDEDNPDSDNPKTQNAALQPIAFTTIKQNSQREEGYDTFGLTAAVHRPLRLKEISDMVESQKALIDACSEMEEAAASSDRPDDDRILGG